MPYAAGRRIPVQQAAEPLSRPKSFPAPTGGWVSADNPAQTKIPFKTYGPTAETMENFFPTQTGLSVMGGSVKHATLSLTGEPVESIWSYIGGTTRELFGACDGDIFNITTPVDPDTPPTPDVAGQTSDYYSTQNFATVGGNFLYALNGTDSPQLYDGAAWTAITGASVPAITGVTTSSLSQANVYRNRLFFAQGGTMNVWYLPVDALGGAAGQVSLAGVFQRGGAVLFTATWSLDSGSGLDDNLVVASTEGELAIYTGSDPSDPNDWRIVGVYNFPRPMGKNGYTKAGGNLVILTEKGGIPITAATLSADKAILGEYAISRAIEPDWIEDARDRRAMPWEIMIWDSRQRAIVSNPVTGDESITPPWCYVVNTTTGAWCKRRGWNTRCLALHNDAGFFGSNNGAVYQMEITGADDGAIYYPVLVMAWDHFGTPGFQKTVLSARAVFSVSSDPIVKLSASADYSVSLPSAPNVAADVDAPGEWDVGLWDVSLWDTGTTLLPFQTGWESINVSGFALAMQVQMSMGNTVTPRIALTTIDVLYEAGEIMI